MAYKTVLQVMTEAANLLGLSPSSAPFAATDQITRQLLAFLKAAGEALVRDYAWSHLQLEHTFSAVNGQEGYNLPADFGRIVDGTAWNRSTGLFLVGPLTPREWQAAKLSAGTTAAAPYFRLGQQFMLYPALTSEDTLQFEYLSRYWAATTGASWPDKAVPTADSDVLWLDGAMLVQRLRRDFLRAKGLDSTAASEDYEAALAAAKDDSSAGAVRSLNHGVANGRLPGVNLPATGWGG